MKVVRSSMVGMLALVLTVRGSNWPQWRGPYGNGISPEKELPVEWSPTQNIQWKTAIPGRGHSSPVIWGKRIFLTSAVEGSVVPGAKAVTHVTPDGKEFLHPQAVGADHIQKLTVLCLDAGTGKIMWERTAYAGTVYDDHHRKNTYATPTPATDGRYIYAFFGSEGLYCYDFEGRLVWKTFLDKIDTLGLGAGSSPILYENLVILQCDQEQEIIRGKDSFLTALDKRTGRHVWRTERKEPVGWATPLVIKTSGRIELVASGVKTVLGYDPATGKELWRSQGVDRNAIPTPVAGYGMVFVSGPRVFAIRLGGSGDLDGTPYIVWKREKGVGPISSPILYDGYIYLVSDKGILTCLDARTGEVKYAGGRVPVPATFTASPLAFNGLIFLTSEDGDTFVVRAGPQHEVLRTNSIGEPVYSSPAVSRGRIFIRGEKNLYCIRKNSRR